MLFWWWIWKNLSLLTDFEGAEDKFSYTSDRKHKLKRWAEDSISYQQYQLINQRVLGSTNTSWAVWNFTASFESCLAPTGRLCTTGLCHTAGWTGAQVCVTQFGRPRWIQVTAAQHPTLDLLIGSRSGKEILKQTQNETPSRFVQLRGFRWSASINSSTFTLPAVCTRR